MGLLWVQILQTLLAPIFLESDTLLGLQMRIAMSMVSGISIVLTYQRYPLVGSTKVGL